MAFACGIGIADNWYNPGTECKRTYMCSIQLEKLGNHIDVEKLDDDEDEDQENISKERFIWELF